MPQKPHIVLVPSLTPGHMIPMLDLARLIADRGIFLSFITTPINAARVKHFIIDAEQSALPIKFIELDFPHAEAGLPQGCESADLIRSDNYFDYLPFFSAHRLLQQPLELYLRTVEPPPSCLLVDDSNLWTEPIARELNIPRIITHATPGFYLLTLHAIRKHKQLFDGTAADNDEFKPIAVPELPAGIQVSRAQAAGCWFPVPDLEASSDGGIINTFYELEPEFVERYEKAIGKRVWAVGPVSLCNRDVAMRGYKAMAVNESQLVCWLDLMQPRSVLLVSLGTLVRTGPAQLIEMGRGLEACGQPFIWVVKDAERHPEVGRWMVEEGFEERINERGLVIRGWAPQVMILSHPSVGGFLTHCGWNSTLEAVTAGVPMVTWPHFADQFINEKMIVEVLKIGVSIGVKRPCYGDDGREVRVKREEIERAVSILMGEGKEAKERRERAASSAEKARKATADGGSSHTNMTSFIEYVLKHTK